MVGPRPVMPPTELVPPRPRRFSAMHFDDVSLKAAIAQAQAQASREPEPETDLDSTGDASSVVEAGSMLTMDSHDEGFLARLSRFTKSGVKRFSLSRLGNKTKPPVKP